MDSFLRVSFFSCSPDFLARVCGVVLGVRGGRRRTHANTLMLLLPTVMITYTYVYVRASNARRAEIVVS